MFPKTHLRQLARPLGPTAIVLLCASPLVAQAPSDPTTGAEPGSAQTHPVSSATPTNATPAGGPLGPPPLPTRQPTAEPPVTPPAPAPPPGAPEVPAAPPSSPEPPSFQPPPFDLPPPGAPSTSTDLPLPEAPLPGHGPSFDDPAPSFPDLPGPVGGADDLSALGARASQAADRAARDAAAALDGTGNGAGFGGLGGGGFGGGGDGRLDALVRELSDHLRNRGAGAVQPVWPVGSEPAAMSEPWRHTTGPSAETPPPFFEPPRNP